MITDYIDKRTANVYGIYGHLGGGKSLTAVEVSLWALRQGWSVTSNIAIRVPERHRSQYTLLEEFTGVDFWALPCGAPRGSDDPFRSCIIIDECAEFFDQFSSTSPILKQFLSWLRHSSKRGQFVFLIVQQPEFIAKSLRLLINKWIVCVDMYQFRLPVLKIKIPFSGRYVWRRIFDKYGNLISRGWNFADKVEIGHYYDTAQSIAVKGRDASFHKISNFQNHPINPFLLLMTILYFLYLTYYL